MANSVDLDQTAENGKQYRPWSDCWDWQLQKNLIIPLKMANIVDLDQIA